MEIIIIGTSYLWILNTHHYKHTQYCYIPDGVHCSDGLRSSDGVHCSDGLRSSDGVHCSDGLRSSDGVHCSDGLRISDELRKGNSQSTEKPALELSCILLLDKGKRC